MAARSSSPRTVPVSSITLRQLGDKEEVKTEETVTIDSNSTTPCEDVADVPPPPMFHKPPPREFFLILLALSFCVLLASLDQIIVTTSIPAITREYNSLGDISWLGTAYMMTSTAFQPLYGKVSDIFGRKYTIIAANFIFLVGSAISGWATSMAMLIVGRGVAGVGAGGLIAMVLIILSDMLDMRERGKYIGLIGAIYSLSSVIGPLLGGAFADNATWRWSFWINLPIGGLSVLFIWVYLQLPTPKGSFKEKVKRIDFYGSILLLIAVILLLLPLSWGGNKYEWNSGTVIGLLCAGFVATVIFILVEWKLPREPIVPIHLFKVRNVWSTYGSLFFGGMAFLGILYYLPVYFQVIKGESATIGGLETLPFVFGVVITTIVTGLWIQKKGRFATFPPLGNAFFVTGCGLCILFERDTPRVASVFILLLCGFGMGFVLQASTLAVQVAVKPKYMASVTAMVQFVRSLGNMFGIAIVGSVFNNKLESAIRREFPGDEQALKASQNYGMIATLTPEDRERIYDVFMGSLHNVFYCSVAFCGMALIASVFIQHMELKTNENQQKTEEETQVEMV